MTGSISPPCPANQPPADSPEDPREESKSPEVKSETETSQGQEASPVPPISPASSGPLGPSPQATPTAASAVPTAVTPQASEPVDPEEPFTEQEKMAEESEDGAEESSQERESREPEVVYVQPRDYTGVIRSGEFGMQGLRSTMEDHTQILQHPHFNQKFRLQDNFPRSFFAVYDGHGGSVCSEYCSRHVHNLLIRNKYMGNDPKEALRCGLRLVERAFLAACRRIDILTSSGTTAICVYIEQGLLVCGNVGDSRAVLCTVDPETRSNRSPPTEEEELRSRDDPALRPKVLAVPLSIDHKPARDCERLRVESRGGQVATTAAEAKQVQQQHLRRREKRLAEMKAAGGQPGTPRHRHLQSAGGSGLRPGPHESALMITTEPGENGRRRRYRGKLTPRERKILETAQELDEDRELATRHGVRLDPGEGLRESKYFLEDQTEYAMQNFSGEDSFGGDPGVFGCCSWCCSWIKSWTALDRPLRVFPGGLSVSRAIGDIGLKRDKLIVADAEMSERELTPNDRFIILACDGVWDVMGNQAAVEFVYQKLIIENLSCHSAAAELAEEAYRLGSTDNISVVVVQLGQIKADTSTDSLSNGNNPYYCAVSGEVKDGPAQQRGTTVVLDNSGGVGKTQARQPFASLSQAQAAALRIKVDEVVHHPPQVVLQPKSPRASPLDILLQQEEDDQGAEDGGDLEHSSTTASQPSSVMMAPLAPVTPSTAEQSQQQQETTSDAPQQ